MARVKLCFIISPLVDLLGRRSSAPKDDSLCAAYARTERPKRDRKIMVKEIAGHPKPLRVVGQFEIGEALIARADVGFSGPVIGLVSGTGWANGGAVSK